MLALAELVTITISVLGREVVYQYVRPPDPAGPVPAVVLLGGGTEEWQAPVLSRNWTLIVPQQLPYATDENAKALEGVVEDASKRLRLDAARIYLAGQAGGAAGVLYARSRIPHLWAAAVAIRGNARAAIESNRLFAANGRLLPLLWLGPANDPLTEEKLKAAAYPAETRLAEGITYEQVLEYLGTHKREEYPMKIDCETGSALFPRCFWLEITRFDPARRNDVLGSSRVRPGAGASLALGGFGYNPADPGPGLEVAWLPEGYKGALKLKDRIVSVGGKPIANALDYARMMDQMTDAKPVAVLVQRGRERLRLETQIVLPKREEVTTARVQAEFSPETRDLLIISRGIAELRLTLPEGWAPATVNWNGNEILKAEAAACWLLSEGGSPAPRPCP